MSTCNKFLLRMKVCTQTHSYFTRKKGRSFTFSHLFPPGIKKIKIRRLLRMLDISIFSCELFSVLCYIQVSCQLLKIRIPVWHRARKASKRRMFMKISFYCELKISQPDWNHQKQNKSFQFLVKLWRDSFSEWLTDRTLDKRLIYSDFGNSSKQPIHFFLYEVYKLDKAHVSPNIKQILSMKLCSDSYCNVFIISRKVAEISNALLCNILSIK